MNFPLLEKKTDLGKISNPKIPVFLKTRFGFKSFPFLLDTGADFTMLPASFAEVIGLKLDCLPKTHSYGIEGRGITVFVAKILLKLGKIPFEATAFLSTNESTPLILGRQGLFDRFNIRFDNRRKVIRISPL